MKNMTRYVIFIILISVFPISLLSQDKFLIRRDGHQFYQSKHQVKLLSNIEYIDAQIASIEYETCSPDSSKKCFSFIGSSKDICDLLNDTLKILRNMDDNIEFIKKYVDSDFLHTLSPSDFKQFDYAVIFIDYNSMSDLDKENFFIKERQLFLSYEEWTIVQDYLELCLETNLYVIRLKRTITSLN